MFFTPKFKLLIHSFPVELDVAYNSIGVAYNSDYTGCLI